jgi:hypothetical protein
LNTTIENAVHAWVMAGSGLAADKVIWAQQEGPRPSGTYVALRFMSVRQVGQDWADVEDNPLVVGDTVESVDAGADTLTLTAHGLLTGDGPIRIVSTGTVPGGLVAATDYWVIKIGADTIKLAASFPDSINTVPIDLTSAGTGTITIASAVDTVRAGTEITHRARGVRTATLSLQCFAPGAPTGATSPASILESVGAALALPVRRAALNDTGLGTTGYGPVQSLDGFVGRGYVFEPRAVAEATFALASEVSENSTFIDYVEVENLVTATSVYVPEDPTP